MEVQIEADQRCGSRIVLGIRQLVDVDGKNRSLVTMRFVAGRRTRAAIAIGAEIGAALDRALRVCPESSCWIAEFSEHEAN
jgi:hypothetical protein